MDTVRKTNQQMKEVKIMNTLHNKYNEAKGILNGMLIAGTITEEQYIKKVKYAERVLKLEETKIQLTGCNDIEEIKMGKDCILMTAKRRGDDKQLRSLGFTETVGSRGIWYWVN